MVQLLQILLALQLLLKPIALFLKRLDFREQSVFLLRGILFLIRLDSKALIRGNVKGLAQPPDGKGAAGFRTVGKAVVYRVDG